VRPAGRHKLTSRWRTIITHHHEGASAQHELGMKFSPMVTMADQPQIYKYCITQVRSLRQDRLLHGEAVYGDNGSGMHCHQSIWDGQPVFAGNKYADLSETCLSYIAGVIRHAKATNAFTNPTTNSYKRLVPGFEAPVLLAIRSATARPHAGFRGRLRSRPSASRLRFPDPLANPYLGFAAILMAGLDGIKNKLDTGPAIDRTSTICRRRNSNTAARCARRWAASMPTAPSSRWAAFSTTISSTATSISRCRK
jgi:glutamine synthetase